MSKIEIPGFYRFLRRRTRTKILNKQRHGYRGVKQRYSVWRAEYNQKWEKSDKDLVERICRDNELNLCDYFVGDENERTPWEKTLNKLRSAGFGLSKSPIKELS